MPLLCKTTLARHIETDLEPGTSVTKSMAFEKERDDLFGNFDPSRGLVQVGGAITLHITAITTISARVWARMGYVR